MNHEERANAAEAEAVTLRVELAEAKREIERGRLAMGVAQDMLGRVVGVLSVYASPAPIGKVEIAIDEAGRLSPSAFAQGKGETERWLKGLPSDREV